MSSDLWAFCLETTVCKAQHVLERPLAALLWNFLF